jgi:hypothetical protein
VFESEIELRGNTSFLSIDSYDVMNGILDNIRFNFLNNQEVIEALKTCGKRSSLEGKGEASSKI